MSTTVTVNIISRWDAERILFSAQVDASIGERFRLRAALEIAVKARANLAGANLAGAYLAGAYLDGAYLDGANLDGANLAGAYLARANLAGANLAGANLDGANLAGAYLDGAYLDGETKLAGERPLMQIGPIGSVSRYLVAYITTKGLRLRAGCFFGTRDEFVAQVGGTHGDSVHGREYMAALASIDAHYELWAPKESAEEAAA